MPTPFMKGYKTTIPNTQREPVKKVSYQKMRKNWSTNDIIIYEWGYSKIKKIGGNTKN